MVRGTSASMAVNSPVDSVKCLENKHGLVLPGCFRDDDNREVREGAVGRVQ